MRDFALPSDKRHSILTGGPYSFRHTVHHRVVNAAVPVAKVARQAENFVEVIPKRDEGCVDGGKEQANKRIDAALSSYGAGGGLCHHPDANSATQRQRPELSETESQPSCCLFTLVRPRFPAQPRCAPGGSRTCAHGSGAGVSA